MTTLFLSQGVPMLVAGDEISRTQGGNNNAYCQDNEISWLDWAGADEGLLAFTKKVIHLRKNHPVFCRRRWFQGQPIRGINVEDIAWFLPSGDEMNDEHWDQDFAKSLGVYLNGRGVHSLGPKGEQIIDDSFYVIFNAAHHPMDFTLPSDKYGNQWIKVLDTRYETADIPEETFGPGETFEVDSRSVVVLRNPIFELEQA